MIDILERWEKTTLLTGVPNELKAEMAYILENQIHHNEHISNANCLNIPAFKRLSVPLARRVYPHLESHKKYNIGATPYLESCLVTDLGIRGCWDGSSSIGRSTSNLDQEVKQLASLADKLKVRVDEFIDSQAPFHSFKFQCFGTNEIGNVALYYDID